MAELGVEMDDVVVAVVGHCPRHWLQSADIIVSLQDSISIACLSAVTTLADYPGCAVALALHAGGQWLVAATRGFSP
jgi:CBS-domain-containing membrane protein